MESESKLIQSLAFSFLLLQWNATWKRSTATTVLCESHVLQSSDTLNTTSCQFLDRMTMMMMRPPWVVPNKKFSLFEQKISILPATKLYPREHFRAIIKKHQLCFTNRLLLLLLLPFLPQKTSTFMTRPVMLLLTDSTWWAICSTASGTSLGLSIKIVEHFCPPPRKRSKK